MNRLKKIMLSLVALFITASLALWVLAKSVSPDTIKNIVSTQLSHATNKTVSIKGGLHWQLFPRPAVAINDISIGDMNAHDDYALHIETLMLNVKLSPLIKGQVVFNEINILNWQVHLNADAPKATTVSVKNEPAAKDASSTKTMAINRLTLNNGELLIEQNKKQVLLNHIKLDAEGVNVNNSPFSLRSKLRFAIDSVIEGRMSLDGTMKLDANMLQNPQKLLEDGSFLGQLKLSSLKYQELKIDSVNASVKAASGRVKLEPLSINLYQAQSIGYARYTLANNTIEVKQTATGLDAKTLTGDLTGQPLISGKLDYALNASVLASNATDINAIVSNGQLSVHDGELEHVNLKAVLDTIKAKFDAIYADNQLSWHDALALADTDTKAFTTGQTPFKLASVEFNLKNGMLLANKIILQTEQFNIGGQGQLGLDNQRIQGRLDAKISSQDANQRLLDIQNKLGGQFVLMVSGTLGRPVLMPDTKLINHVLRDTLIKKTIGKKLEQLDVPVKDIGKEIKSLFR